MLLQPSGSQEGEEKLGEDFENWKKEVAVPAYKIEWQPNSDYIVVRYEIINLIYLISPERGELYRKVIDFRSIVYAAPDCEVLLMVTLTKMEDYYFELIDIALDSVINV